MKSHHPLLLAVSFLCALLFTGSGCGNATSQSANGEPLPGDHWFELTLGDKAIQVQLAVTQRESNRGLMHRTELGTDSGMIFIHPRPMQASFWMRNTPLPLDIGFFDQEGKLLEIYPLFPYDETPVRSRSHEILIALEMNQGWFSRNKIRPGARLDLEELRAALRARGFDPANHL